MAAITKLGETWNTTAGNKTVTATPAVNDLIVVVHGMSGWATGDTSVLTDDQSGTYTQIGANPLSTGGATAGALWVSIRTALIPAASSTIFTATNTGDTGGGLTVFAVSGMSQTGASAARQSAGESNQTENPPVITFGSATLTTNPIVVATLVEDNPTGLSPPSGFTNHTNTGWSAPTTGLEIGTLNSGGTASVYTWVAGGATDHNEVAVELSAGITPTRGQVSWTEQAVPFVATRGRASWTELQVPLVPTRGRASWAEIQVPTVPTRGRGSWSEFETPAVPTRGRLSWTETQVPDLPTPTRGRISWTEAEAPLVPTRGRTAWLELQVPTVPTRGRIAWGEAAIPSLPTRGQLAWTEAQFPLVPTRGRVAWGETQIPLVPTRGRAAWAETEVPAAGATPTRGRLSWTESEIPSLGPTSGGGSTVKTAQGTESPTGSQPRGHRRGAVAPTAGAARWWWDEAGEYTTNG